MRKVYFVLGGVLLLISAGILWAQVDLDEALTCDPNDLIFDQIAAQMSLDSFGLDVEQDPQASLERLYEVGLLYQELALECGYIPPNVGELFVGFDVERVLLALESVQGDPINGQLIYNDVDFAADGLQLGCIGCHLDGESTGPATTGTWTRWDEIHSKEARFEGYTFAHYVVESILLPWDYTVEGYPENIMPNNFGSRMSYQNLADIITYLESQDQLLDEG